MPRSTTETVTLGALFVAFLKVSLYGVGGVAGSSGHVASPSISADG